MPYNQDEVIASVTDYYQFLIKHLHFFSSELRTPPPDGWPQMDSARFSFLNKTEAVIDLYRHLPYFICYPENIDWDRKEIWCNTVCNEYAEPEVEKFVEVGSDHCFEPLDLDVERSDWDTLKKRMQDVATIAKPECADKGCYIWLDTLTGEVVVSDVMLCDELYFDSASECFAYMRRRLEEVEVFPTEGNIIEMISNRHEGFQDLVRSLGWPPEREGSTWKKDEGMKETERRWPEFD